MTDCDGVVQTRFINPKNYDPKRMDIIDSNRHDDWHRRPTDEF